MLDGIMQTKEQFYKFVNDIIPKIISQFTIKDDFFPFGIQLYETSIELRREPPEGVEIKSFAFVSIEMKKIFLFTDLIYDHIINNKELKNKSDEDLLYFILVLLFHEVSHIIFLHDQRCSGKDFMYWNFATDYFINTSLIKIMFENKNMIINKYNIKYSRLVQIIRSTGLYDDKFLFWTEDEIYNHLLKEYPFSEIESIEFVFDDNLPSDGDSGSGNGKNDQDGENSGNGGSDQDSEEDENDKDGKDGENGKDGKDDKDSENGKDNENDKDGKDDKNDKDGKNKKNNVKIKEIKIKLKSKDGRTIETVVIKEEKDKSNDKSNGDNNDVDNSKSNEVGLLANTIFKDKILNKGDLDNNIKSFLKKIFKVKIDWRKILNSIIITNLVKSDDLGWQRYRTSSYTTGIYLPGFIDEEKPNKVVFAIDESGSMTDDELCKGVDILYQSSNYFSEVIAMKHSVSVTKIEKFDNTDADKERLKEFALQRLSAGGTSHIDVFEKIKQYKVDTSLILLFTDGYSDLDECYKKYRNYPPVVCLLTTDSCQDQIKYKKIIVR